MSLGEQVAILYAVTKGFVDDVPVDKVIFYEENFHRFMKTSHPDIEKKINEDKEIKPDTEDALRKAVSEFSTGTTY